MPGALTRLQMTPGIAIAVLIIVLMVAVPLTVFMTKAQRQALTTALVQRVDTLLGVLAIAAADSLSVRPPDVLQLSTLPDQAKALNEATYMTLTAAGVAETTRFDYVWVSSDSQIDSKLEAGRFNRGRYGQVRIRDALAPELVRLRSEIDNAARLRVSGLAEERSRLVAEAMELRQKRDAESQAEANRKDSEADQLYTKITSELQDIRGHARSFPPLDPQKPPQRLELSYVFYVPIVFRRSGEDLYFRGAVRLGVSTHLAQAEMASSQRRLIFLAAIIALVAAGVGMVSTMILARPARKRGRSQVLRRGRGVRKK